jgi:hypothetical protein
VSHAHRAWHNHVLSRPRVRAVSSAVEHCLHTAGVAGSNPAPPTKEINDLRHLRVAFAFLALEKCWRPGLSLLSAGPGEHRVRALLGRSRRPSLVRGIPEASRALKPRAPALRGSLVTSFQRHRADQAGGGRTVGETPLAPRPGSPMPWRGAPLEWKVGRTTPWARPCRSGAAWTSPPCASAPGSAGATGGGEKSPWLVVEAVSPLICFAKLCARR